MRVATAILQGVSPISFGRHYCNSVEKLNKESPRDYEARTWREKCHYDAESEEVYLPANMLKNSVADAAKFLSMPIPGKGKATYTKHFAAGLQVFSPAYIGLKKSEMMPNWLFVPSDGMKGGGKRVEKCFPIAHEWSATAEYNILDATITQEVFEYVLAECGRFIGMGTFRPINGGYFGRFRVESIKWQEV